MPDMSNTTEKMDTAKECRPDTNNEAIRCIARSRPSHVNGYFNGKTYLVKTSDFDRATFFALKTEEERFRYFEERVDIIWDFFTWQR
ncbi:uncharacterized protein RCC_05312 [Ramularia collo-cygni]|uniref:Uncharacterized protein n=1 Tax=Ramularia collo-cygni TaxID=112498 RepID=A0A2D3UT02_9PEZI|nr:uncharacterized protein RCC_05312 [Ramularia collo-cygni]CZT19461.1 uncharacterized protein RCC_05312 [Ramularia collo-cygni]